MIDYSGKEICYNGCPGCAYAKHEFSLDCGIAYENDRFTLSHDWELPIYGFFVVCPKRHVEHLSDLSKDERDEMFDIVDNTIKILKSLNVCSEFNVVLEEMADKHLHTWIMPRHKVFNEKFGNIIHNIDKIFAYAIENWKTQENINNINHLTKLVRKEFAKQGEGYDTRR